MAVELYSENSGPGMSPRISFSHDLSRSDVVPVEQLSFRSNSSSSGIDFDFCIREGYDLQESSSADELFSDGKLLPIQIKKKFVPPKQIHQPEPPATSPSCERHDNDKSSNNESLKEMKSSESDEKQSSKSFWRFKRSSSLNCGSSGYARSLCPLPPLLSRSNSAGSATNVKRSSSQKQNSQKNAHVAASKPSQSSSSSSSSGGYQRPPLRKSYGSYGNGVRINPVLNVPSGNLFGLGSIFFNGKDKNKKK